jgi:uncharacterized lipoprotein NlpE involved in copper resistance
MRTLRRQLKQISAFFIFIAILACNNSVFAEPTETSTNQAEKSIDWPGIYYGFTPCDGCEGIKTTLALNKNSSYMLMTQNVGPSKREFVEKGKFTWDSQNKIINLTPRDNSTPRQYSVDENILIQLDENGNRISGKLADRYILRRTEMAEPSKPHSSH